MPALAPAARVDLLISAFGRWQPGVGDVSGVWVKDNWAEGQIVGVEHKKIPSDSPSAFSLNP
jgi:hypothetical protein